MHDNEQVVEAKDSNDGFKQWRLLRRPNGLYLYEEKSLEKEIYSIEEDGSEASVVAEAYWMPTHVSGLFETSEAARMDALATLSWLHEAFESALRNGS